MLHKIHLKDEDGGIFSEKLCYIYIELPKFKKELEELNTHFEKWLFVLRWLNRLQDRPKELQERIFRKIFKLARKQKMTQKYLLVQINLVKGISTLDEPV